MILTDGSKLPPFGIEVYMNEKIYPKKTSD